MESNDNRKTLQDQQITDNEAVAQPEPELPSTDVESSDPKELHKTPKKSPMIGIALFILHSFVVVSIRCTFKSFPEIDFFILNSSTYVIQFISTLPFVCVLVKKRDFSEASKSKFNLFMMSALISTGLLFTRISVVQIPLGTATAIFYLKLILVMILAYILIDEKSDYKRIGFATLTGIGVICVVEPPFIFQHIGVTPTGPLWAYILAFIQPIAITFAVIFMRKTKDVHFVISMLTSAGFGMLMGFPLLSLAKKFALPAKLSEYLAILGIGLLSTAAALLNILAHHFSDAGPLATVSSLELVLAFLAQILIYDEIPSIISSIGACMVFLSITGLGIAEFLTYRRKKPKVEEDDMLSISRSASHN